jgi:hypothetical protein
LAGSRQIYEAQPPLADVQHSPRVNALIYTPSPWLHRSSLGCWTDKVPETLLLSQTSFLCLRSPAPRYTGLCLAPCPQTLRLVNSQHASFTEILKVVFGVVRVNVHADQTVSVLKPVKQAICLSSMSTEAFQWNRSDSSVSDVAPQYSV